MIKEFIAAHLDSWESPRVTKIDEWDELFAVVVVDLITYLGIPVPMDCLLKQAIAVASNIDFEINGNLDIGADVFVTLADVELTLDTKLEDLFSFLEIDMEVTPTFGIVLSAASFDQLDKVKAVLEVIR